MVPRTPKTDGLILISWPASALSPRSHFLPFCARPPRRGGKGEKMEAPFAEDKLNARRQAVVLKGLPLLALMFQTLGIFSAVPSSCNLLFSPALQGLSTPILPLSVLTLLRLEAPLMRCSSPPSTPSTVSGQPLVLHHPPRTSSVV